MRDEAAFQRFLDKMATLVHDPRALIPDLPQRFRWTFYSDGGGI